MILKDLSIVINSVDHSSALRALTFAEGSQMQPSSAHGDDSEIFERGLRTGNVTAQFWLSFTSGGIDDLMSALQTDDNGFTCVIKPTSAATSNTNPTFTGTVSLANYERFTGEIGDRAICTVELALYSGDWVRADS